MGPFNANHGGFTVVRLSLLGLLLLRLQLLLRLLLAFGFGLFRRLRQFHHFCRVLLAVHVLKQQLRRSAAYVATAFPGVQHWERRSLSILGGPFDSIPKHCSTSAFLNEIRKHFNDRMIRVRDEMKKRFVLMTRETWVKV